MGRNIFIYPGFLVISFSENQFEIVELSKMELTFDISNFLENDFKPKDSEVIGKEWLYQNKDGTRDFRFAGNREIPLVRYGKIYLSNKKDFSAEYMFSNAENARKFYLNLKSFIDSIN